ncbi:hypothetical protein NP233_g3422 [Leucocoprinus birnbaumii]|uniref:DUF155 domain-containing protein n=1 Tax=Leucocoprinus birnbaumii TaxID=56174 RepID=A0AAD5YXZ9_9AGAR|nr:hypothetical protein NP233_g3422 [Leucocoprinus birnbaumii]
MFAVPQPAADPEGGEGSDDSHPIICNDSLEAFRLWCWVLYAGFEELELGMQKSRSFTLEELTHVGLLANKYQCERIEKWALKTLEARLVPLAKQLTSLRPLSSLHDGPSLESLEYLVRTARMSGWSIEATTEKLLLDRIRTSWKISKSTGTAVPPQSDAELLARLLQFADSIGSPELKAKGYYEFLGSRGWCMSPEIRHGLDQRRRLDLVRLAANAAGNQTWWESLEALSDRQQLCLYRGFQALSSLRNELKTMPKLELTTECRCMTFLPRVWEENADEYAQALIGPGLFLVKMRAMLERYNVGCGLNEELCAFIQLLKIIDQTKRWLEANLSHGSRRRPPTRLPSLGTSGQRLPGGSGVSNRRASVSGLTAAPKTQRTSKTVHKLVELPSAPQTRPLIPSDEEDLTLGVVTDGGIQEYKSEAERMTKEQREQAGFKRLTAYCVAESFRMKLLASFLKREHNVAPRIFDEALYTMYHLPLLPGYGPNANIRSSAPAPVAKGASYLTALSEAEEDGYQGSYFTQPIRRSSVDMRDGYISSPVLTRSVPAVAVSPPSETESAKLASDTQVRWDKGLASNDRKRKIPPLLLRPHRDRDQSPPPPSEEVVEVVFFEYGVVVFFGLTEGQEKDILEDIENAGIMKRKINEDDWEIEECHFTHDPYISYPRIYNDFFTLKSRSHLLKLSIAHALAQSTLLAHYEAIAQRVLSSPQILAIPQQLASSGSLQLRRREALKLTGKLFKLKQDVNLVSNVLDVPELFWTEASLGDLYDAVREYMEIAGRVESLNEKLGVASEFLDAIHDHLNNSAMDRITWIVIWLIVVAILVELGEVIARLIVHATLGSSSARSRATLSARAIQSLMSSLSTTNSSTQVQVQQMSREDILRTLEKLMAG